MPTLILNIPRDDGQWQEISVSQDDLKRVGRGAVSDVYVYSATDGRRYAIKIFNSRDAPWEKLAFLQKKYAETAQSAIELTDWATTSHGTVRHAIGWPISIVYSDQFVLFGDNGVPLSANKQGFVLPFLDPAEWSALDNWIEHHLLEKLGNTSVNDSLIYRLMILKNCAAALAQLHSVAIAMVDVKPANIRVEKKSGRICLLDVDSFRVSDNGQLYPATHVSSGYIWPVAQAHNVDVASLDQRQDCYAYAVLVFRVLNYGIHPFQSKPANTSENGEDESSTLDTKAKAYLYAYGNTEALSSIKPLPQSVHDCWAIELRDLLSGAFTKDGHITPMEKWESYFKWLLDPDHPRLASCTQYPEDPRHIRFDGYPCMKCVRKRAVDELKVASIRRQTSMPIEPTTPETSNSKSGVMIVIGIAVITLVGLFGVFLSQEGLQKSADTRVQNLPVASSVPQASLKNKGESLTNGNANGSTTENPFQSTATAYDICERALNSRKDDWDSGSGWQSDVRNAQARGLSIDECRNMLGLGPLMSADGMATENSNAVAVDWKGICGRALNSRKDDWDSGSGWQSDVRNAQARGLSIDECRNMLGLGHLMSADGMAKKAKAKECSAKADAQGLHGKARKDFREKCKQS